MRRALGPFEITCLGVNAIVGAGIFALPDDLYRELGWASPLAFVLCALGLLPVALCYAEAAGGVDRTGGPYVYARRAFGPSAGFVVGWMCFVNSILSFAAVTSIAVAYGGRFFPQLAEVRARAVAGVALVGVFAALNYVGARPGARVAAVFTLAKLSTLAVLIVAAAPMLEPARFAGAPGRGLSGLAGATFVAVFAVQGFEVAPVPAGETLRPERTMPRAILFALGLSSLLYVIVQTVVVGVHPELGRVSDTSLGEAARAVGPGVGAAVAFGGVLSTLGFVAGNAFGTPRYAFAAAEDGFLPRSLAVVHPRFETPHRAVIVTCALAAALSLVFDYRRLIGMSNLTVAVQYLSTCAAVLVLRRSRPTGAGSFRAPGGAFVPLCGLAMSLWIFAQGSIEELEVAAGALGVGLIVAWASRRAARS